MAYDTVVDKAKLESGLTEIADLIRAESDVQEPIPFPELMATELGRAFRRKNDAIQQAKNETKAFIERTYTQIYNEDVVRVSPFSHYYYEKLKTAEYPNAASAGESAFEECTALTSVSLPNAEIIGTKTFKGCTKLSSLNLPKVYEIRTNAFDGCTALESIDLPALRKLGQYAFAGCTNLKTADLHNVTSIPNHAFRKASSLSTLYLRSNSVVTLADSGAFYGVKTINVYVPANLIESYMADKSWKPLLDDQDKLVSFLPIPVVADGVVYFSIVHYGDVENYQAQEGMTWAQWCESEYNTSGQEYPEAKYYAVDWGGIGNDWGDGVHYWDEVDGLGNQVYPNETIQATTYRTYCP